MENNYYLSIGTKLGGHYEIEKVLSEDEFEILYLARDLHKRGEYVVLKELFLKSYSLREGTEVSTLAKSKIIFEETKKEVQKEVETLLEHPPENQVQTYGTFEENNTIYTIMEFVNNSDLDGYLKVTQNDKPTEVIADRVIEEIREERTVEEQVLEKDVMQEEIIEPQQKKRVRVEKEKKPKSSLFLNILITTLLICVGLGYYAYNMIKEDKQKIKERPRTTTIVKEEPTQKGSHLAIDKEDIINDNLEEPQEVKQDIVEDEEAKEYHAGSTYIEDVEAYKKEQAIKRAKEEAEQKAKEEAEQKAQELEEKKLREEEEKKLREEEEKRVEEEALKNEQMRRDNQENRDVLLDEETSNHPENDVPSPFKEEEKENLPLGAVKPNTLGTPIGDVKRESSSSLGRQIGELGKKREETKKETTTTKSIDKKSVKQFLDNFLTISESGSIDEVVSNYDEEVGRYFSLRNVGHDTIRKDKTSYHNKWTHREFDMLGFDVTKVYKKDGETYCDVKTTTNWSVSNGKGKSVAGTSKGVMTLRKTDNGFKVTSIYTDKSH